MVVVGVASVGVLAVRVVYGKRWDHMTVLGSHDSIGIT